MTILNTINVIVIKKNKRYNDTFLKVRFDDNIIMI